MTHHSVNNNTRMDLVMFLYSNSNHLISLIPPKLPQILEIYSVVTLGGTSVIPKIDLRLLRECC